MENVYGSSGCGPNVWVARKYYSRKERKEWLESYAEELEQELTGVRERITELGEG